MSLTEVNEKIIQMGLGLLYKIKYAFSSRYSEFHFLRLRFIKQQKLKNKISHSIYKKKI